MFTLPEIRAMYVKDLHRHDDPRRHERQVIAALYRAGVRTLQRATPKLSEGQRRLPLVDRWEA